MPAKSKSQERLMNAVAHNPAFAKKVGISQKVGKEFVGMAEGGKVWNPFKMPDRPLVRDPDDEPPPKAAEPASAPSNAKFFTQSEKGKRLPPKELLQRRDAAIEERFAKGGSIDGCAQRGKTRATRS